MSHLITKYASHSQRVCRLYKLVLKECRNHALDRLEFRFNCVMMRARFDQNANITDPLLSRKLLEEGEEEFKRIEHPQPYNYPDSPGGSNYGRAQFISDHNLDSWHPLEKAQFPEYFERRAKRKKEYLIRWHKKYGKTDAYDEH